MFDSLDIPASALVAQRARMETIAGNVSSSDTPGNEKAGNPPYRRRFVVLAPGSAQDPQKPGVHIKSIGQDMSPFRKAYDPGHKDADADGYVQYPNIEPAIEMVNMMEASRAYEANITMMESMKAMITSTLRLLA